MAEEKHFNIRTSRRIKFLIGFINVLLIVFMFPRGESLESEITVGSIWLDEDLIASFSFPILKDPDIYNKEIEQAIKNVYPIYTLDEELSRNMMDSLRTYNKHLLKVIDSVNSRPELANFNLSFISNESFNILKSIRRQEKQDGYKGPRLRELLSMSESILSIPYQRDVIEPKGLAPDSIGVRRGKNIDHIERYKNFLDISNARYIVSNEYMKRNIPFDAKKAMIEYTNHFLIPNVKFDEELTSIELEQAKDNVSRHQGIVNENERIVGKHERITNDIKLKIDSYKEAKGERIGEEGLIFQFIGKFLHISFLLALLSIYIYLFRKKIFYNNEKLILISINIIFFSFLTFLTNQLTINAPIHFLIFIPAASIILTIMFDSRVGFYSTVIIALITGALRGNDYSFAGIHLFSGALAVYTVRDIKNRNQIFRSFLYILLGYALTILAFGLERFESVNSMAIELSFALTNAIISPVLAYGLLIFFERAFRITTDLTLVELANFDRPILKDLARKAPGTFTHSMTMGTLCEAAAEVVRANPLLARVGAYYHDIGKIITPQNFVENQLNNSNIHENLKPEESAELLKRHIEEGIELAIENKLPVEIIDFIPMHHGTTVMSFFYEKAKKIYGEENVNIEDFRYKGPKPNTKEAAIIMLADGCESAVRSIENPDAIKVENVISKIIQGRIDDKQLDEAPITFGDINKIKEVFASILLGQHHRRIRYPQQEEMEKGVEKKD